MRRINVTLEDENSEYLNRLRDNENLGNLDNAINKLIKEAKENGTKFRKH
ncbi:MAG: hypothetical protein AABY22_07630 [Nanoarchaeota archaeon]